MTRHLIGLAVGLLLGAMAAAALLYMNPLAGTSALSPISVSEHELLGLRYSAAPQDSILYTNDGESGPPPHPDKVLQLWEAPIRQSEVLVAVLADSRNNPVGIGVKFMSASERTRIINGEILVDSVWHILLPGRGSLFVAQTENHWDYITDIVMPAHWSSADNWKGTWSGNMTVGPGSLGTAHVTGGSGDFAGLESDAVESLSARAYSVANGPVAMDGQLTIEIVDETGLRSELNVDD